MGQLEVEEGAEKSAVLVVLFEDLRGKSALLGGQLQQLLVVELRAEAVGQQPGDDASAGAYLSAHVDDEMIIADHCT